MVCTAVYNHHVRVARGVKLRYRCLNANIILYRSLHVHANYDNWTHLIIILIPQILIDVHMAYI